MKRKQLAAIALSAILSFSACIPATGFGVYAAENDAAPEFAALETVEEGGSDETAEAEAAGQADESVLENAGETLDSLPEVTEETAEQADENLSEVSQEESQDVIQEDSQDVIQEDSQDVIQEDSQDVIQEDSQNDIQEKVQEAAQDSAQEAFDTLPGDTLTGTDPAEDVAAEEIAAGREAATPTATEAGADTATEAATPAGTESPSGNDSAVEANDAAVETNDTAVEANDSAVGANDAAVGANDAAVETNEDAVPDGNAVAQDDLETVTEEGGQQEDVSEEAAGFVEEPGDDEFNHAQFIHLKEVVDVSVTSDSSAFFSFSPDYNGKYIIYSTSSGCNPAMVFYDEDYNEIAAADDENGMDFQYITFMEETSTYYVQAYCHDDQADYQLHFEKMPYYARAVDGISVFHLDKGSSQTLRVEAGAPEGEDVIFHWYRSDGMELSYDGRDPTSCTIENVQSYTQIYCDVCCPDGSVETVCFDLYVNGVISAWPRGGVPDVKSRTFSVERGDNVSLEVSYETEGRDYSIVWYDGDDQVIQGVDWYFYDLDDIQESCTFRCHVADDDDPDNCDDVYFYINVDSGSEFYVYPEGGDRDNWSIDVDITSRDSVTLRTVVDTDGSTEGMTYKWEAKKFLDSDITELSDIQGDTCEVIMPQKGEYFCTVTDAEGHSGTARFCLIMENEWGFSVFGYDRYGSQAYDRKITYDADDNDGPVELMIGVDAGVTDRLSYQWYKDTGSGEELIDGAVAPEYTVDNPVNGTAYTCIVDYGYGDEPKALTYLFRHFNCLYVYADTERLVEAVTYDPREAESFTLSPYVTADDMEGLTYEWKKGHGSDGIYTPTGDTSPSLTVNSPADEDVYTCTVTDRYGNQGTGWFYFYADTHLNIYAAEDPSKQGFYYIDITGKETLTLNAVAEADEGTPLTYYWNRVDAWGGNYDIEGAAGELIGGGPIALQLDTLEAGTAYNCILRDNYGHMTSLEIHLVSGTPALNIYPGGASEGEDTAVVNVGYGEASVELAVNSVTDSEGFYYTWKNAAGETVYSSYNVPNYYVEQPKEGERYSCTVTDRFGQEATVWFELHLEENPDNPTEEEMAGAAVIRAGESVHVDVEPESRGEFFKFVPEKTCVYTLTSTFDENGTWNSLRLELYDSDYNPVAVDKEDDYFNSQTLYTFLAGEGETCYLRARSEDDFSAGSYTLSLAENAAFCAYGSDMVRQISPGEETSFEVTAWSPAALHYQWYYSTESEYYGEEETPEIPGATGTSYTPASPLTGYYTCKVWDDGGQSKDLNFNLTVDNHLYVENSYSEISCQAGEPAVLTVNASADDTEGLVYTWQKYDSAGNVWVDIQGISGNSYTIPEAEESTEYRIRVTDRYNNSYDATIQVSVDNQFSATYVLHDGQEVVDGVPTVTLYANGSLDTVLEVAVQGADTNGITYEWGCKSGDQSTITLGETSSTCRPQYDGYYFCRVTDRFGNTREVTFRVIIVNDPHFTDTDDIELEYAGGEPTTLKVGAAALNQDSLRYLWYKCVDTYDTIFLGETSENYLDVTPEEDEERYFCCLTDIYRHYDDSSQVNFIVRKKILTNLADAQLTVAASGLTYNGKEHKPAVTVKYDGKTLVAGRDYEAAYENNKDAGTARVIVTGIGNYEGTAEKTFSIAKASQTLQAANLSVVFAAKKAVSVTGAQGKVTYSSDKPAVAAVEADGNVTGKGVGSAKITISAAGNKNYLSARKVITATITAAALKDANVTVDASGLTYNGKEQKPAVTVKYAGKTLTANTDYKVAYKNNINAGTDTASVTVTGLGNYKASVTKTFSIAKAGQTLTIAAVKVVVGKTAAISVTGAKGTKTFTSANTAIATVNSSTGVVIGKKVGSVKITVTSKVTSNYKAASKAVTVTVLPAATSKITATNLVTGIKVTWNKVTGASGYILYRNGTKIATLTGNAKVTYTDSGANTNGSKYVYKVVARAVIGSSTLNSTASRSLTTYRVARPAVSSLTNSAASKMTVKWAKNAKASGYQIQYSTDSTFKSGVKTVTISSASTVSKVIANLAKTKTYCVMMRTFKTVGTVKYYSAWSAVKKLKITK